jgi:ribosome-associated protein
MHGGCDYSGGLPETLGAPGVDLAISGLSFIICGRQERTLETIEIARKIVEAASEKQATDIVLLDVKEICSFADYFVICNGESGRQINAIADEIEGTLRDLGVHVHHTEGGAGSGWVLVDVSDVLVHIFSPESREFYAIDNLWSKARLVMKVQ